MNVTDGGEYSCTANYSGGYDTSNPALLYGKKSHNNYTVISSSMHAYSYT